MNKTTFATGRCTCGEIRYELSTPPMFVHCCHCTWCQRETGSAFALNAIIEADRLRVTSGMVEQVGIPTASGKGQVVSRCPQCRVALWSNYAGMGDRVHFVRTGTLENPSLTPPDIHIYTSTKQPWVVLPDDVLAVTEYYRAKDTWPADSVARFRALRERADA